MKKNTIENGGLGILLNKMSRKTDAVLMHYLSKKCILDLPLEVSPLWTVLNILMMENL